jgi:hypothetical protein
MFLPTCRHIAPLLAGILALTGCSSEPDNAELAAVEAAQARDAAQSGRVFCALNGAEDFALNCTLEQIASSEGTILVIGRAEAGYRRFRVTTDGSGVETADGAERAQVTLIDDALIEVSVADDRYRLPASQRAAGSAAR